MERLNKEGGVIMNFYKITNREENHNNLQYKTGLNIDTLPWNPNGDCEEGGIYFSREDIFAFVNYGSWVREVTIPEGTEVYENPGSPKKWKAHKVILGERQKLSAATIRKLLEQGADIHTVDDYVVKWASENGHFETVKLLIKHGANIHANDEEAFKLASCRGCLETVKLLIKHGANIHANNDIALRWAIEKGHLEVVKTLIEHGANIQAHNNWALRWASAQGQNGNTEVAELLIKHGASK